MNKDFFITTYKDNIISSLCSLIKIPSIFSLSSIYPFGNDINCALEDVLALGDSLGFRTKNIDGFCGYIEFGSGELMTGILCHLDVVPDTNDWSFPPFDATIADNKIYGRGAIDNKGSVIASIYAMKYIMDNLTVKKRIRLILGLDEERNWHCIDYYKKHEQHPDISFSPDADFPCIFAEKTVVKCHLSSIYSPSPRDTFSIVSFDCNDNPLNVVPKFCSCKIHINENLHNLDSALDIIKNLTKDSDLNIDINLDNNSDRYNIISISSTGKSAHAAHPDLGVNAISQLLSFISILSNEFNTPIPFIEYFNTYISLDYLRETLRARLYRFFSAISLLTLALLISKMANSVLV